MPEDHLATSLIKKVTEMNEEHDLRINIVSKHHEPVIEEHVRERLEMVVGRFGERLASIEVHLKDENANKGGVDKTCSIDAKLIPRGTLHVHATEREFGEAIRKAIHRLETVVAKTVDRGHHSSQVRHAGGGLRNVAAGLRDENKSD